MKTGCSLLPAVYLSRFLPCQALLPRATGATDVVIGQSRKNFLFFLLYYCTL